MRTVGYIPEEGAEQKVTKRGGTPTPPEPKDDGTGTPVPPDAAGAERRRNRNPGAARTAGTES